MLSDIMLCSYLACNQAPFSIALTFSKAVPTFINQNIEKNNDEKGRCLKSTESNMTNGDSYAESKKMTCNR